MFCRGQRQVGRMRKIYTKTLTGMIEAPDGTRRYFKNGAYGRENDLPSVEYPDGSRCWYCENPKRGSIGQRASLEHREGGPAVIRANGDAFYYLLGKLSRLDGPAVELASGVRKWFDKGDFQRIERPSGPSGNASCASTPASLEVGSEVHGGDGSDDGSRA